MNLTDPIFQDADKAREHLEAQRWPNGPVCPHCGVVNEATKLEGRAHRAGLYQCNACRDQFTATVGTVFERSKVALNKWLLASYLMASSKKGISAHQIGRTLGVTYKTAWFMCHRIREAMAVEPNRRRRWHPEDPLRSREGSSGDEDRRRDQDGYGRNAEHGYQCPAAGI